MGNAFSDAFRLLMSGDRELYMITLNSLHFAVASTLIAAGIGIPGGLLLAFRDFPGKRAVVATSHTLMGLPTVVVGLLVYSFLSRSGPFGSLGLMFSPTAIIIGQSILGLPIVLSLVYGGLSRIEPELAETLSIFRAGTGQRAWKIILEGRVAVATAVLSCFGRVIGEVGVAMMLGGNIRWYTRTITTAMALETAKGAFSLSIALGVILLTVAFGVNFTLNYVIRFRPQQGAARA